MIWFLIIWNMFSGLDSLHDIEAASPTTSTRSKDRKEPEDAKLSKPIIEAKIGEWNVHIFVEVMVYQVKDLPGKDLPENDLPGDDLPDNDLPGKDLSGYDLSDRKQLAKGETYNMVSYYKFQFRRLISI